MVQAAWTLSLLPRAPEETLYRLDVLAGVPFLGVCALFIIRDRIGVGIVAVSPGPRVGRSG